MPTGLGHLFLMSVLKNIGFGENLMTWIETVTKSQESSIIDSDKATQYCKPQRGVRQGNPISTYLFIPTLKV